MYFAAERNVTTIQINYEYNLRSLCNCNVWSRTLQRDAINMNVSYSRAKH